MVASVSEAIDLQSGFQSHITRRGSLERPNKHKKSYEAEWELEDELGELGQGKEREMYEILKLSLLRLFSLNSEETIADVSVSEPKSSQIGAIFW